MRTRRPGRTRPRHCAFLEPLRSAASTAPGSPSSTLPSICRQDSTRSGKSRAARLLSEGPVMPKAMPFILVLLALVLPACGGGKAEPKPTPTEDTYLSHRGQVMPLRTALRSVAFQPFIPAREIVETALLPPYNGGDDVRKNRGIAFEYISSRQAYVLSQWPGPGLPGHHDLG